MEKDSTTLIITILNEEGGSYSRRKEAVAQEGRRQLPKKEGSSCSEGKETVT